MEKILSIIIPTYNMEKYLHKTLSSLLIGKNEDMLDVMVINDGSKDSSLAIAREFEEKYPETFRAIDKPNGNYGSCINRGLKEAKGKYIKVLDADDSYDTKSLATLVECLASLDVDLCLTDYIIVDEEGKQTGSHIRRNLPKEKIIEGDELFNLCLGDIIEMHEIVYRTENLRRIGYTQTEGIAYTDQEWIFLPMTTVRTAYYLPISVYKYLVGRQGQSTDIERAARLQIQGDKTLFVQMDSFSKCKDLSPSLREYLIAHLSQNIKFTYRTYLITAYKALQEDALKEIDKRIKECDNELYEKSASVKVHPRIPLYFVRDWRKANGNVTLSIRLYRSIIYPILRKLNIG